jgi:hypothetical protein
MEKCGKSVDYRRAVEKGAEKHQRDYQPAVKQRKSLALRLLQVTATVRARNY